MKARPMTQEEIEKYNELPALRDPSREQIKEKTRSFRSSWSEAEKYNRSRPVEDFLSLITKGMT